MQKPFFSIPSTYTRTCVWEKCILYFQTLCILWMYGYNSNLKYKTLIDVYVIVQNCLINTGNPAYV